MPDETNAAFTRIADRREIGLQQVVDTLKIEDCLKSLQDAHQLSPQKTEEMKLIAGELGKNVVKHGGQGKIIITHYAAVFPWVEIITENVGALPADAMKDGVSTRNTLGLGLGMVSRLSDAFIREQDGYILRMRAVKYCLDFPNRSEVAVLSYPVMMHENCNGDAYFIHKGREDTFCVIDALGHGEEAHKSAAAVLAHLNSNPGKPVDHLVYGAHELLKAKHLRGAAMVVVRLDYEAQTVLFAGLGDALVKIFPPNESGSLSLLPQEGIVGDVCRTLEIQKQALVPGTLIAVYSDGISSRLAIPWEHRTQPPLQLVNELMAKYGKLHDDRTLLLAKIL
ncbi:MAG: ATP-binding protein [candidate division FCPU426 bacterium]